MNKRTLKWLLLPGGVTQLLHMIAALRAKDVEFDSGCVHVLSLCYFLTQQMVDALMMTADMFGIKYVGNMDPTYFKGWDSVPRNPVKMALSTMRARTWVGRILRDHGFSVEEQYDAICFTLRPWVYDELLIDCVLRPKVRVCVIDGISPENPERKLDGVRWRGIRTPFNNIPCEMEVWCPAGLEEEAFRLGVARTIDKGVLNETYRVFRCNPLATRLEQYWDEHLIGGDVACIFSQQISQSGHCSLDCEVQYYIELHKALIKTGCARVIFKPHPRDSQQKLMELSKYADSISTLTIMPEWSMPIPVEPFADLLRNRITCGVSCNSTAALLFRVLARCPVVSYSYVRFSKQFNTAIRIFCDLHSVPLIVLE